LLSYAYKLQPDKDFHPYIEKIINAKVFFVNIPSDFTDVKSAIADYEQIMAIINQIINLEKPEETSANIFKSNSTLEICLDNGEKFLFLQLIGCCDMQWLYECNYIKATTGNDFKYRFSYRKYIKQKFYEYFQKEGFTDPDLIYSISFDCLIGKDEVIDEEFLIKKYGRRRW